MADILKLQSKGPETPGERKFTLPFPRSNTSPAVCLARSNVSVFCPILF